MKKLKHLKTYEGFTVKNSYIPTYEEAVEICEVNKNFYENTHEVNGYKVSTFNYRIAGYEDFINPLPDKPNVNARELRGLTFIFNEDGSLYKKYLHLQKFWNINQVEETFYQNIKDYKIVGVADKLDGSLVTFVKFPNGDVLSKTQNSFDNEQTEVVNKLYKDNESIQNFIKWCEKKNYVALFEYVSFMNKIVLDYDEPQLILLRVRDNDTGEYIEFKNLKDLGEIPIAESEEFDNLEDIIELAKNIEDKEGWVITLQDENGQYTMVKQKTDWYFIRHRLNDKVERENDIIELILDNTIDDILSQLDPERDASKIKFINDITKVVSDWVNGRVIEVQELVDKFDGDIRDFAIRYKKDKNFGMAMMVVRGYDTNVFNIVKEFLKKNTNKLEQARSFIKRKDFKRK